MAQTPPTKPNIFKRIANRLDRITIGVGKERDYLVENLSMLVAGGMTILASLDAIAQEMHSRSMKRVIKELREAIENGSPLWKAVRDSGIFRDHTVALIRIGEESGRLSENLKLISIQEEKDRTFRSKTRSAMMYPVLVLTVTLVVGVGIAWFILPRLATVFAQLSIELPLVTQWLIAFGAFLGEHGTVVLPIFLVVVGILIFLTFFYSKTKHIGSIMLFNTPGVKGLLREIELARFGYLLGTLLEAGLPVTQALDSLHRATQFPQYKKLYAHVRDQVEEGNSFQKSFAGFPKIRKYIPAPIQQLVVTGEQSGNLAQTLLRVSATFETKTELTTKNLSVILEPVLLVIVWGGVVGVALAVILPIYNLIGGFNPSAPPPVENEVSVAPTDETVEEINEVVVTPIIEDEVEDVEVERAETLTIASDLDFLNVRDEPSLDGEVVGRALPEIEYIYRDTEDGWYEIEIEGDTGEDDTGWVFGELVTITDEE